MDRVNKLVQLVETVRKTEKMSRLASVFSRKLECFPERSVKEKCILQNAVLANRPTVNAGFLCSSATR